MSAVHRIAALLFVFALLLFAPAADAKQSYPGATVIERGPVPMQKSASFVAPNLQTIKFDKGQIYSDGCLDRGTPDLFVCDYGSGKRSVVLFGDSHALHHSPALLPLADKHNWTLHVVVRASCGWTLVDRDADCNEWRRQALEYIGKADPDLVLLGTSVQYYYGKPDMPYLIEAAKAAIQQLGQTGAELLVLRDGSTAERYAKEEEESIGECVSKNMRRLQNCFWKPGERGGHSYDMEAAREMGVPWIDVEDRICRPLVCPLVVGNIITRRDASHYSATFMKTMANWMGYKITCLAGF